MQKHYIYTIYNILNNKIYIGKSKNPPSRWNRHIKTAYGNRKKEKFYIHRALVKHSVNNFIFSTIQSLSNEDDANKAEKYWIKFYQSNNSLFGYNQTEGGEGCSDKITSEATREKMRLKATGRKHTEETKELLRKINLGKIPASLPILKIIHVGKKLPEEHSQKISAARFGMKFTDEHKKNISKAKIGTKIGKDNPFYGKTHTEKVKEQSRGENNKQSKLTAIKVSEIREKYSSNNYSQQQLADEYKVSRGAIRRIIHNITWIHIKENL